MNGFAANLAWFGLGVMAWMLAGLAGLGAGALVRDALWRELSWADGQQIFGAVWMVAWTGLAAGAIGLAAGRFAPGFAGRGRGARAALLVGGAIASAVQVAHYRWAVARLGPGGYEIEHIGAFVLVPAGLVAVAVAAWACLAAPRRLRAAPTAALVIAFACVVWLAAPSVVALRDGLAPDGVLLAGVSMLATVCTTSALVAGVRRFRAGA